MKTKSFVKSFDLEYADAEIEKWLNELPGRLVGPPVMSPFDVWETFGDVNKRVRVVAIVEVEEELLEG